MALALACGFLPLTANPAEPSVPEVKDKAAILNALGGQGGVASRSIVPRPRRISLQIQFEHDSAILKPDAGRQLDELWLALGDPSLQGKRIEISGHTDSIGNAEYNRLLSERRAEAVRAYLASKGAPVDASQLVVVGHGESQPLPELPPEAPQQRRVEIRVL